MRARDGACGFMWIWYNGNNMKQSLIAAVGLSALVLPALSLVASINLQNGGLGQLANNVQNFGVAVCNGGASAVNQSVPVSVSASNQTASVLSASSIAKGACTYSYLSYAQLNMQPGSTYTVVVTIDPNRTVISNSNNQTSYTVTVPGAIAQAPSSANGTANVGVQSGNFFSMLLNWLVGLFGGGQ
jgi:hypothetical protein